MGSPKSNCLGHVDTHAKVWFEGYLSTVCRGYRFVFLFQEEEIGRIRQTQEFESQGHPDTGTQLEINSCETM